MHSTLKMRDSDPHDIFAIAPDVVPVAWADKVLADIASDAKNDVKNDVESDANGPALDQHAASGTRCGGCSGGAHGRYDLSPTATTATDDIPAPVEPPATSRWAKSAVMLVLAVGSAAAAAAWQNHGDAAKQMISGWVPAFALTSSPPTEKTELAAQADAPAAQATAAGADIRATRSAGSGSGCAGQRRTGGLPDTAQLQSMARDLAAMAQQVEQLKASIAELKASQQATARDVARTSEARPCRDQARRTKSAAKGSSAAAADGRCTASTAAARLSARTPAAAPLPQSAPPPVSTLPAPPPPQATARTEDGETIVRPPMPLR